MTDKVKDGTLTASEATILQAYLVAAGVAQKDAEKLAKVGAKREKVARELADWAKLLKKAEKIATKESKQK